MGHILYGKYMLSNNRMLSHLVSVMGQGGIDWRGGGSSGTGERTIRSEEEEEVGQESCSRLDELASKIKKELEGREKMFEIMIDEDSDLSDIDVDEEDNEVMG